MCWMLPFSWNGDINPNVYTLEFIGYFHSISIFTFIRWDFYVYSFDTITFFFIIIKYASY